MNPFEKFLETKTEPGLYDSIGSFTISGEKALEKLSEHTLGQRSEWILKMVQGAVGGGARRLVIKQLRSGTRLDFHFSEAPDCQNFQQGLLNPNHPVSSWVNDMLVGLRVLLLKRQLVLEWDHGTALLWNGAQFTVAERSSRISVPFRLLVKNTATSGAARLSLRRTRSDFLDEIQQLKKRALYAPIELELDGRKIDHLSLPPPSSNPKRDHCRYSPRNLCAGYFQLDGDRLSLNESPALTASGFLKDSLRGPTPFVIWPGQQTSNGRFTLFVSYAVIEESEEGLDFLPLTETFQLLWTRHGVVGGVVNFPFSGFGGSLQLDGDSLSTDLAGLELDTSPGVDQARSLFRALSAVVIPTVIEAISNHQSRLDKKDLMEGFVSLGIAGGVTGYVAGTALLSSGPAIACLATAGGLAGASVSNKDVPNVKGWLCRHLANSHQQLLQKMGEQH